MPTLTIYLTNELYDKVKNSPSKIVRAALEKYFKKDSASHEENEEEKGTSRNS
jgi:metal-responsive CopG/Arc/MetJ family transcriptional regulator